MSDSQLPLTPPTPLAQPLELSDLLGDEEVVYTATQIFDALSDYTRFQILSALMVGERSVGELQEICSSLISCAFCGIEDW